MNTNFAEMVGQPVTVATTLTQSSSKLLTCVLRGVEAGGLWLESENLAPLTRASLRAAADQTSHVVFLPFAKIDYVFQHFDNPLSRPNERMER